MRKSSYFYCESFGADVKQLHPGAAKNKIREHVDFLEIDRPLYPDHTEMQKLVRSNEILKAVEKAIGSLD